MTLLIKSVQVLGCPKKLPEKIDIFVSGERISALGNFSNKKADEVLDGQGMYVAPGFIDVNTNSDHTMSIFDYPSQEDFLRQGVTTIVGGQGGLSLAPLLYGPHSGGGDWGASHKVNVGWRTFEELVHAFLKRKIGVNFATFVGHETIRRAIVGNEPRDLTKNEMLVFYKLLKPALKDGGVGLSVGLNSLFSRQVPPQEIKLLNYIVKGSDGVYSTGLRKNGFEMIKAVEEIIKITKETGVKTLINNLVPQKTNKQEFELVLDRIGELSEGFIFRFSISPFGMGIFPLYNFLPDWIQSGSVRQIYEQVQDEWLRPRLIKDMVKIDAENFFIMRAPHNPSLAGLTLKDFMELYDIKDQKKALLKLMLVTKMHALILHKGLSDALLAEAMRHPKVLFGSNALSFDDQHGTKKGKHDALTLAFPTLLGLAQRNALFTLPELIKRITVEPARLLGLKGRGEIKEGNFADLVGFRGSDIKFTVVNGRVAYKNEEYTGALAGRFLKHESR